MTEGKGRERPERTEVGSQVTVVMGQPLSLDTDFHLGIRRGPRNRSEERMQEHSDAVALLSRNHPSMWWPWLSELWVWSLREKPAVWLCGSGLLTAVHLSHMPFFFLLSLAMLGPHSKPMF